MKDIKIIKMLFICMGFIIFLLPSCEKDLAMLAESKKDIVGSWKIVKLTRNSEDMTTRVDLSKFRVIFNQDNTYTLQDQFPFLVSEPGTYSLDDPQYPFFLKFQSQSAAQGDNVSFEYPIVNGKRQIKLKIELGCSQNTYEYFFEKAE